MTERAQYDEGATLHMHRCTRCGEEFTCRIPEECRAQYEVLPNIVVRGPDGHPCVVPHCWDDGCGNWIPHEEFDIPKLYRCDDCGLEFELASDAAVHLCRNDPFRATPTQDAET